MNLKTLSPIIQMLMQGVGAFGATQSAQASWDIFKKWQAETRPENYRKRGWSAGPGQHVADYNPPRVDTGILEFLGGYTTQATKPSGGRLVTRKDAERALR